MKCSFSRLLYAALAVIRAVAIPSQVAGSASGSGVSLVERPCQPPPVAFLLTLLKPLFQKSGQCPGITAYHRKKGGTAACKDNTLLWIGLSIPQDHAGYGFSVPLSFTGRLAAGSQRAGEAE